MLQSKLLTRPWMGCGLALLAGALLAGCPYVDGEFDQGLLDGRAEDTEYWYGFWDSWDTVDGGTIYYDGHNIPFIDDYSYDAGYWDGAWYAYHDGYFASYDYAFAIGFSEGYDLGYRGNWATFLATDYHIEWLDGGFTDGYEDGFSEGRIFGAWEYDAGWTFDWVAAIADYWAGTDIELPDLGVGTGAYGDVILYEPGVDPWTLIDAKTAGVDRPTGPRAVRRDRSKQFLEFDPYDPYYLYRPLTADAITELTYVPALSPRSSAPLTLVSSWLDRVDAYVDLWGGAVKSERAARPRVALKLRQ